jgi:hypothetical protein
MYTQQYLFAYLGKYFVAPVLWLQVEIYVEANINQSFLLCCYTYCEMVVEPYNGIYICYGV